MVNSSLGCEETDLFFGSSLELLLENSLGFDLGVEERDGENLWVLLFRLSGIEPLKTKVSPQIDSYSSEG